MMTEEIRSYLILELTTTLGTLALAFAQIGPLHYNSVTGVILFIVLLGIHIGLLSLTFPKEIKESGLTIGFLLLYWIPAIVAFAFACYACLASWSWTGIPQIQI